MVSGLVAGLGRFWQSCRAAYQVTAAIWASVVERLRAIRAPRAFIATDERRVRVANLTAAPLTLCPHL